MNSTELDGRTIKVNESRPCPDRSAGGGVFNTPGASSVKLFVGNLSFETKEETIHLLFEAYGDVLDWFMYTDRVF